MRIEEQREALRSPRIPGQRSAGRYEDPNEAGSAASELCEHRRPEGLEWRAHGAKRSAQPRNTAQASAQGGAKMRNDHAELRGAWARNTPRRKIPFSRAKIVSLQFPRPEIRRILAETGGGARRPPPVAETGRSKPNEQGRAASALCARRGTTIAN